MTRALRWAGQYTQVAYLNPNGHQYLHGPFRHLLACGASRVLKPQQEHFEALQQDWEQHQDWLFGYLNYDLKNELEQLSSANPDTIGAPLLYFFCPQHVLELQNDCLTVSTTGDPEAVYEAILSASFDESRALSTQVTLQQITSREHYLKTVQQLRDHIEEGDIYEINYCTEFTGIARQLTPIALYEELNRLSPMPFSSYLQLESWHLLSASPERYLKKEGDLLVSQPIKGTRRRGTSAEEDQALIAELRQDPKERAENMMIVDLVRNDLARSCQPGTVTVEELFGINSYEQVHQMTSTVTGRLHPAKSLTDALKGAFPMGSMTGAPKIKVMELIEHYEQSRRGIYSGAAGYLSPEGDFDFNVVIRSIVYEAVKQRLSFMVGSAITWDSDPEQEYEECLLKAAAMLKSLDQTLPA